MPFDRDLEGHFVLSREAAHSAKRIVRVSGDRAGAAIMQALIAAVRATPSIRVLEGYEADRARACADRATASVVIVRVARCGAPTSVVADRRCDAVVLATGGIGQLYAVTTNPAKRAAQGIAMAARAGAVIADAEFVQFHPTAIDIGADPAPLATRGAARRGRDAHQSRRPALHASISTRTPSWRRAMSWRAACSARSQAGRGAFLDCRKAIGAHFAEAFPTVYARCREAGIDPVTST